MEWVWVENWVYVERRRRHDDIFISVVLTQPDSPSKKLMRRNGLAEEPPGCIYTCHHHPNPGLLNLQLRPMAPLPHVDGKLPVCICLTPSPSAARALTLRLRHTRSTLPARVDECFFKPRVKYESTFLIPACDCDNGHFPKGGRKGERS